MTEELPVQGAPPDLRAATPSHVGDAPAATEPPTPPPPAHAPAAVQTLKQAMRRARLDDAERAGVIADLRAARIGRLELLEDALKPLAAQIPEDVDLFDFGLMPGAHPRLFIDMIGFVEMGRDARRYRLLQDTRHGRVVIAESDSLDRMVDAITDYVAYRLLERDKALAADADNAGARRSVVPHRSEPPQPTAAASHDRPNQRSRTWRIAGGAFAFLIDLLGSITFFTIIAAIGWVVWSRLHGQG